MDTCTLGDSNLNVTRMGLGLAALGRPGYINLGHSEDLPSSYQVEAMQDHAHRVLTAAWDAGVRYFDSARSYGRAEAFLSSWLEANNPPTDAVTIGSKWGYTYTADWRTEVSAGEQHEVKDHSRPVLDRQLAESLSLFGDQLDVYQIHSATIETGVLENDDVLDRLTELRDSGVMVGFSTSGPNQAEVIRKGLSIERGGKPLFGAIQATWNLLETSAGDALAEAYHSGRGVIIKEGLANGRLTSRNDNPEFHSRHERLFRLAQQHQTTVDAISLAAALRQPWTSVVLSGAASVEHLLSNLKAIELQEFVEVDELLGCSESPDEYWSIRGKLAWN